MFRSVCWLVVGLALLVSTASFAQEAVLGQEYGTGVHAYFAGDNVRAYEALTSAIQGGSKDPRAFYFRGLAYLKLGRQAEAVADFRKGAELESKDINRFYNVGKALERVQGPARLQLENHRVEARMIALEEEARIRRARYEAIQREEARVLREQAAAAPADASKATPPPIPPQADADPFATPEDLPRAAKPPKKPTAKAPADSGDEPKAEAEDDNPFGGADEEKPKGKDAKKAPAKKSPPKDAGGDDNPFGGDEEPAPKDKKTPKKPEKDESEDPFNS